MTKVFAADEIRLNLVNILSGIADPSAGAGVARPLGSFYARSAGSPGLYQKTTAPNTGWERLSQSFAWLSVLDFGADPTGTVDATASFQAAIDAAELAGGRVVYVPRGTYLVSQIEINGTGVQLIGSGPGSVILWTWNAATAAGSCLTIRNGALSSRVSFIRFSGAGLTNPAASRANHLLLVDGGTGGTLDTKIEECWFGDMVANSGDGVHLQGTTGNLCQRTWVRDNVFDGCSRYGVGGDGGIHILWVVENHLTNCLTEIALLGTVNAVLDAVHISQNEVIHTSAVDLRAMRLEGHATALFLRSLACDNVVNGGFVTLTNAQFVTLYGNPIFSGSPASSDPVVRIFGNVSDSIFVANIVVREGGTAGPVITLTSSGGAAPVRLRVGNNVLFQAVTGANIVTAVDLSRWSFGANILRATDAGSSTVDAIDLQAVTVAMTEALIGPGNMISAAAGTFRSGVRVLENGANIGAVSIVGNQGNQIAYGARFEETGAGTFTGNQLMFSGNNWSATTGDYQEVGVTVTPRIGFNAGVTGAQLFTGTGTPEGVVTAQAGSQYLNRSGGSANTLWYKETGTGNTGWIAVGGAPFVFGVGSAGTVDTALYMANGFVAAASATILQIPITRRGTLRNLRVQVTGAGTGAATVTYTAQLNGVDTALLATISNTATGGADDLVNTVPVTAGQLLAIKITKSAAVAVGQTNVTATVEIV